VTGERTLDARGLKCPMPILRAKKEIDSIPPGVVLKVVATDPGSVLDFQGWVKTNPRLELLKQEEGEDSEKRRTWTHHIRRKE
jgi:tRNA 2-thiouridine synthesizing protein A